MSSRSGAWFIWCRRSDAKPANEVKELLAKRGISVTLDGEAIVVAARTQDGETEIVISLVTEAHVATEAAELAERRARDAAESETYRAYDARYEMLWPLELEHVAFPFALPIGTIVRDAVGGLLVDMTSGNIVGR